MVCVLGSGEWGVGSGEGGVLLWTPVDSKSHAIIITTSGKNTVNLTSSICSTRGPGFSMIKYK